MSTAFWNERYGSEELVYGRAPNAFVEQIVGRLSNRGHALDIAAGEGRNALYLASLGFDVLAVDQSAVGMQKAQRLARERGLRLRTQVTDLGDFDATPASFDVITSTFVHLPKALRDTVHRRIKSWLKPGGVFVLEAYAPDQIDRDTGGPKDPSLLAPLEEIVTELAGLEIVLQAALVRDVSEGCSHTGEASVVQVVARSNISDVC